MLLTWAAVEVISLRYRWVGEYRAVALAGSLLPDMGNFTMVIGSIGDRLWPYFQGVHTPVGFLLLGEVASYVFKGEFRRYGFLLLALGGLLHIFADLFIVTLEGKIMLLFPLSVEKYGIGVFRQGGFVYPIIAMGIAGAATLGTRLCR